MHVTVSKTVDMVVPKDTANRKKKNLKSYALRTNEAHNDTANNKVSIQSDY